MLLVWGSNAKILHYALSGIQCDMSPPLYGVVYNKYPKTYFLANADYDGKQNIDIPKQTPNALQMHSK
jgi:hypothetical protein